MISDTYPEDDDALSEIVSITLIIALVLLLVGITASVLLGYTDVLTPHILAATTAEDVPLYLNATTGMPGTEAIALFLEGGDEMRFGEGGTARIALTTPARITGCAYPENGSLDWKPGDHLFISRNGTEYLIGKETPPASDGLAAGLWQVALVDTRSNVLIAKHGVRISGSGETPPVLGEGFTVEAWVKWTKSPSPLSEDEKWATIVVNGNSDINRRYHLQHDKDNKNFEFAIRTRNNAGGIGHYVQSTTRPEQGVWYYVVSVYNQTTPTLEIYVNGAKASGIRNIQPDGSGIRDSPGFYQVGGPEGVDFKGAHQRKFAGEIRGLRTWEGAMSEADILSHYSRGLPAA